MKRLRAFSEKVYRFVVETMKEEVTFDEPPEEFKGQHITSGDYTRCNGGLD